MKIEKNSIINCGNYIIHIGTYKETDIAIESRATGEICLFKNIRKGGKLAKIKRKFKRFLCSNEAFYFSFMQPADVTNLIQTLKK